MSIEHVVVWDGRRSGPGGAMLFAPNTQPRAPIQDARIESTPARARRVREAMAETWFTVIDLALAAEMSTHEASHAIASLLKTGEMLRERKGLMRVSGERQRYRFVTR